MAYRGDLAKRMYLYFAEYSEPVGLPSFEKFARSIGVTLEELSHHFRVMCDEPQLNNVADVNLQPPSSPSPSPYPCLGKLHINDSGNCYQILQQTDCYYISPLLAPKAKDLNTYPDIRCLEISDYAISYDIIWIKKKDRELTAAMKRFLRSIYEVLDKPPHDILL